MTKRREASVHGVLAVDKPPGPTSFDVVRAARRAYGTRKVGHTGTLDPFASGVVVVLLGDYTRLSDALMVGDKIYDAEVCFSGRTDTDDHTGVVVEPGDGGSPSAEAIRAALGAFVGDIEQVPPQYAAIKKDGEKLYERARRGEHTDVPARAVHIDEITLLGRDDARCTLRVQCQKGTYIRAIARDLGAALNAPAHLSALRRVQNGPFAATDAVPLGALIDLEGAEPPPLVTGPKAWAGLYTHAIDADAAAALRVGKTIAAPHDAPEMLMCVHGDVPVALVTHKNDRLVVKRGFPARS